MRGQGKELASGRISRRRKCTVAGGPIRKSRSGPWRATVLISVHVAILLHIAHWAVAGRTLSPVEPSETIFTLVYGQINAGVIFFALAILSTLIFGRFFCGWGCHIVALQDLCGWFMKKLGVRPRPFRSRFLTWMPLLIALYLFVWPLFKRHLLLPLLAPVWPGALGYFPAVPQFAGFSNHLVKEAFWETFPQWIVAIPFLLICGFAVVYLLGAKGFCTYGCPYGAVFAGADRLAPVQILADLDTCEKCGHCTATCTSNVRIHEEVQQHGKVVSPGCMKCLDCVSVCPTGALSVGLARPVLFGSTTRQTSKPRYSTSLQEDLALAVGAAVVFFAVRGLYGVVPLLMAGGLTICLVFLGWKSWRLVRDEDVRIHRISLKKDGSLTGGGLAFVGLAGVLLALVLQSVVVSYHVARGTAFSQRVLAVGSGTPEAVEWARRGLDHLQRADVWSEGGWGLLPTPGLNLQAAWLARNSGHYDRMGQRVQRELDGLGPEAPPAAREPLVVALSVALAGQGRREEAIALLREEARRAPDSTLLRDQLGRLGP